MYASLCSLAKAVRKFWKAVSTQESDDAVQVLLDGRKLKTPGGNPMLLPKEHAGGALMVAGEWESVQKHLKSHGLTWTSIVSRAIDTFHDGDEREKAIDKLVAFLHRDTLCYHQDHPQTFVELQEEHWKPLLQWARKRYDVEIAVTDGIFGIHQPDATVARLRAEVASFSPLKLAAFEQAVLSSKSFLISLALMERHINAQQAATAALVEVLSQTKSWGFVEDGHDLDFELIHQQLGAASCVLL
ncbi:hypothetical protein THASP1DRAFT_12726 [Thamnocephalis sphaerospora]|uniref:ATP12-domain-containing protein n=1 Tax=Thamnocephalis sphaerospora TaxID=78915 RepID=A0A4P9XW35_9FUNG|nr:hypothetical protein THASP1DRAFT_12726 [Thamnocephalis sphaerospora]|eukprot:RKP10517.1 hypothetical protein THASP1DRAFT_12726 [Thamnocephalis sphaerospora]